MEITEPYLIPGDTLFYKGIKETLSRVQQIVLGTDLSHSSKVYGYVRKNILEFEADVKVRLHTFHEDYTKPIDVTHRRIYRWNPAYFSQELIIEAIEEVRRDLENSWYGFIEWLTIFIRCCFEWLGFKNAKKWEILWGWGTSCSELMYYVDKKILDKHLNLYENDIYTWMKIAKAILSFLHYNPHTFTPPDLETIYQKYDDLIDDITPELIAKGYAYEK